MKDLKPFIQKISDFFTVYWIVIENINTKEQKHHQDGAPIPKGWVKLEI